MKDRYTEEEARKAFGDDLTDRAMAREVRHTQYGWRVAYDQAIDGDYEANLAKSQGSKERAYWPRLKGYKWRCRCRHGRTGKMCSHVLAVFLERGKEGEA